MKLTALLSAKSLEPDKEYYIPKDRSNLEKFVTAVSKSCLLSAEGTVTRFETDLTGHPVGTVATLFMSS